MKLTLKTTFAILASAACWTLLRRRSPMRPQSHARCRRCGPDQAPDAKNYLGGKPVGSRR